MAKVPSFPHSNSLQILGHGLPAVCAGVGGGSRATCGRAGDAARRAGKGVKHRIGPRRLRNKALPKVRARTRSRAGDTRAGDARARAYAYATFTAERHARVNIFISCVSAKLL